MNVTFSVPDALAYGSDEAMPARVLGQSVDDAAFNLVRDYPGGAQALAPRVGMNPNTLLHKTDPAKDTHQLTVNESTKLQALTGNYSILHAQAHALGHVAYKATPDQSGGDPVEAFMRMEAAHADYVRALADGMLNGGAVSPNQMRRVDAMAQESIATIGHALAALRARMRKAPEGAP